MNEDNEHHSKFKDWADEARRQSEIIWGYAGLIDDNPEEALRAYLDGEDATTYVLELGEDLELFKATKYWLGGYGI